MSQIPLKEIKKFALVSHIYWFLWSLVQEKVSLIRFDYKVSQTNKGGPNGILPGLLGRPSRSEQKNPLVRVLI